LETALEHYHEWRNHPDENGVSGLAPYLHFGFISPFEMIVDLLKRATEMGWSFDRPSQEADAGTWWNLPPSIAQFLDQLVVWRELGLNLCLRCDDYDRFESLPDWAKKTLTAHASDRRPITYTLEQLENAQTHDRLWNAAQNELREEGRLHNYLRMLWGKKILEWTPDPQTALEWMIYLNNKYGLDGSDPNSYTGISWIFGRYDRPWGPDRPIFGLVRYMSTDSARRKIRLKKYLERYAPEMKETQVTTEDVKD
ncbi:MAG TPA: deoxyribodipyrimidine photolyase, partial [Thermogutta sp.]|nr:deoxyribodipyrimidine photolyase [Thermogutta sp.]